MFFFKLQHLISVNQQFVVFEFDWSSNVDQPKLTRENLAIRIRVHCVCIYSTQITETKGIGVYDLWLWPW